MLTRKYRTIKQCLATISKIPVIHRKLLVLANMYLDIDKGFRFSYLSDENGETDLLSALAQLYTGKNFTFFDVGAHVGTYTDMIVERFQNYRGHLFDLSPPTLEFCRQKHGANPNLTINEMALGDQNGSVEYRFYPKTHMQNGISTVGPYIGFDFELKTAPCATGDTYCADHKIDHLDLLKIDTEGFDLHVLRGFDQMLSRQQIDVVQFEYNIKSGETHAMLGDFYAYLESKGYVVGVLRPHGVQFQPFEFRFNDFNLGPNYVACLPTLRAKLAHFPVAANA